MPKLTNDIRRLAIVPLVALGGLCLMCGWWHVLAAPALQASPHNTRTALMRARAVPGRIYSAPGDTGECEVILGAQRRGASWESAYPGGEAFCHLSGYNERTGLVPGLADALSGQGPFYDLWGSILHGRPVGADVSLTVNPDAQRLATQLLNGLRGAAVALDAQSGAVLCLVSAPGFQPADVLADAESFELFRDDPAAPELNRAVKGLYPPGSVMKVFTLAAALDAGLVTPDERFTCSGEERVGGSIVKCRIRQGHGRISVERALSDSCNVVFAKIGQRLGARGFLEYADRFHLLDPAQLPFGPGGADAGRAFAATDPEAEAELIAAAYGQGPLLLTPYALARMTLCIASDGRAYEPYIVDRIRSAGGVELRRGAASALGQAIGPQVAAQVAGMMRKVVEEGTGASVALRGVSVAAKTGSAQNPHGEPHAWITAFAPVQRPRIVVTVVVENGGTGGGTAGPIARQILELLLER